MTPLYLDYAATTPVDPRVAEVMGQHLTLDGVFANPASRTHRFGWDAEEAVELGRSQLATLLGCDVRELVFTSGATEANNLAIKGMAEALAGRGRHLITSPIEHKAVVDCFKVLEAQGFEVSWLAPEPSGVVAPETLAAALRPDTILVSLMAVHNELGVKNDLAALGALCRDAGVPFHVDGAQALGKMALDLSALPVDLMSFSGHKIYGPKGVGALYVNRGLNPPPVAQMHGGGHERGLRSGTLPTHQIVGLGAAAACYADGALEAELAHLEACREAFLRGLGALPGVHPLGSGAPTMPGILNLAFDGVDGETLQMAVASELACSSGSACNSVSVEPSFVLTALGVPRALAFSALRFSFGRFTTVAEVEGAGAWLAERVLSLRSPVAVSS
ncbi:MAG: aminotransferase class V-fold PLP-dependent enzyme [Pseudomonadales bacterium]|nr:aminotransferase class V-fold PLP-dependent enzyme [Pseudomonadales bacterium]